MYHFNLISSDINQMLRITETSVKYRNVWFMAMGLIMLVAACDSASTEPELIPLETQVAEDIPADPISGRDLTTGQAISNNLFTLYDLDANQIVLSSSITDLAQRQADSTGTVWDIGFRGTTIIFNGGESGPGEASAQILVQLFDEVVEAPAGGYIADGENTTCPQVQTPVGPVPGSTLSICTGSGNGWYNYDSDSGLISPIPGRTIVMKTATGNYASLRFLSYYQGNPNPPDPNKPSRYYTFEFIVQSDGSRDLRNTTGS